MPAAVLSPGGARQELRAPCLATLHQLLVESRYRVKFGIDLLGHLLATLPILLTAWAFSDGRASDRLAELTGLPDQFTFMILGLIAFTSLGIGNMVLLETHVAGGSGHGDDDRHAGAAVHDARPSPQPGPGDRPLLPRPVLLPVPHICLRGRPCSSGSSPRSRPAVCSRRPWPCSCCWR